MIKFMQENFMVNSIKNFREIKKNSESTKLFFKCCSDFVNKHTISMGSRVTSPKRKLGVRKQAEAIEE